MLKLNSVVPLYSSYLNFIDFIVIFVVSILITLILISLKLFRNWFNNITDTLTIFSNSNVGPLLYPRSKSPVAGSLQHCNGNGWASSVVTWIVTDGLIGFDDALLMFWLLLLFYLNFQWFYSTYGFRKELQLLKNVMLLIVLMNVFNLN